MTTPATPADPSGPIDDDIRALADELANQAGLSFEPATLTKGVVKAFDFTGSPPTLSIQIAGDTSVTLTKVRLFNNYSPEINHTVLIAKQGADIIVLGHIAELSARSVNDNAGGWKRATLSNGSHGGNENGDIYYRRILDHGSWKIQWRGGWNTGGETVLIDTGEALPTEYRPTSRRSVLCARSANGAVAVKMDFNSDGTATMVGGTTANYVSSASTLPAALQQVEPFTDSIDPIDNTFSVSISDNTTSNGTGSTSSNGTGSTGGSSPDTDSVDPGDVTGGASAGTAHTHGVIGSHYHTVNSHSHSGPSHSHSGPSHSHTFSNSHSHGVTGAHRHQVDLHRHDQTAHKHVTEVWVDPPAWVSLNGVEYFV